MIKIMPSTPSKSGKTPSNIKLIPRNKRPKIPIIPGDKFFLMIVFNIISKYAYVGVFYSNFLVQSNKELEKRVSPRKESSTAPKQCATI